MPNRPPTLEANRPDPAVDRAVRLAPGAEAGALRSQRLLALFAAGWLLLNVPLLTLWDRPLRVAGLPLAPLALFTGWAVLIALAGWVAESRDVRGGDPRRDPQPEPGASRH